VEAAKHKLWAAAETFKGTISEDCKVGRFPK
jgi:hypothetical protein